MKQVKTDYSKHNENIKNRIKEIRKLYETNLVAAKKREDELVLSLSYLVKSVIYKYKRFDNYDDLYQEGMIAIIGAINKYNTDMTFHFTRYALWWIKSRVSRSVKKRGVINSADGRTIFQYSIEEKDILDYYNQEDALIRADENATINDVLNDLPEMEKKIIQMRYGMGDYKECNLLDMSNAFDIGRESIRKLEWRILDDMRSNEVLIDECGE